MLTCRDLTYETLQPSEPATSAPLPVLCLAAAACVRVQNHLASRLAAADPHTAWCRYCVLWRRMACEARWGSVLMRVRWPAIQRLSMAVISEDTGDAAASGGGGAAAAGAAGLGRPSGMLAGMDRGAIDTLRTARSSRLLTSIGQRHRRHTCRLLHHVHKHDLPPTC